jgi:hypothetical protein
MKDLFSRQSQTYARYRPVYPNALYEFLLSLLKRRETAWDCGTGNGQVAFELAKSFVKVYATDISEKQLSHAKQAKNIEYILGNEAVPEIRDQSVDLVCVAQALHWFDQEKFYTDVRRVARQDAVLAVWGYNLIRVQPEIDKRIFEFYTQTVGPFWHFERKLVDGNYSGLNFPFDEIVAPELFIESRWTLNDLRGFLDSWSAVQLFIDAHGTDPVAPFIDSLQQLWQGEMEVKFPIFMRVGRIGFRI